MGSRTWSTRGLSHARAEKCALTLRSSGPPPDWPAKLLWSIIRFAGQSGSGPLSSNVRAHAGQWSERPKSLGTHHQPGVKLAVACSSTLCAALSRHRNRSLAGPSARRHKHRTDSRLRSLHQRPGTVSVLECVVCRLALELAPRGGRFQTAVLLLLSRRAILRVPVQQAASSFPRRGLAGRGTGTRCALRPPWHCPRSPLLR